MTKKQNVENINKIVDSLIREVNKRECATTFAMGQAILTHDRFIAYLTENPDIEATITRNENGQIVDLCSFFDFKTIVEKRLRWNFRNLKDERGFHVFHQFSVNRETGKTRYIPPRVQSTFDVF